MNPIQIQIVGRTRKTPQEICRAFLDTDRWSEFTGYGILPGIQDAHFELRTPNLVGSRVRVRNTDGSGHVEEITQWDENRGFALRFQEFQPPLKNLASHFVETWAFRTLGEETEITRSMAMYPKNLFARLMLIPISRMMKKAFEEQQTRG